MAATPLSNSQPSFPWETFHDKKAKRCTQVFGGKFENKKLSSSSVALVGLLRNRWLMVLGTCGVSSCTVHTQRCRTHTSSVSVQEQGQIGKEASCSLARRAPCSISGQEQVQEVWRAMEIDDLSLPWIAKAATPQPPYQSCCKSQRVAHAS